MTTIKAFVTRHPVATYFALAFAISWGGFVLVVGPGGFPGSAEPIRHTLTVRGLGDARRPQRRRPPVDRPRLWKAGPSRAAFPVAQVAGGSWMVRGGALACPALGSGGTLRAFAHLPDIHGGRQGYRSAVRYRGGADDGLGGGRLDRIRRPQAEAAPRCPDDRAHRGRPVGGVAPPAGALDRRHVHRRPFPRPLHTLKVNSIRRRNTICDRRRYGCALVQDVVE